MSYEIVKSIKIKDGKVFVNCASNNVRPLYYEEYESQSLSTILKEKGEEELNLKILRLFEEGSFQSRGINNKWTRALKNLFYVFNEEYKNFDWRRLTSEERRTKEQSPEFRALLIKALNTSIPKEKYIIKKQSYAGIVYCRKITNRHLFYTYNIEDAKIFNYKQEAENTIKNFGLVTAEVILK